MKTVKAWAVVRLNGSMPTFSSECPIYWYRKPAKSFVDSLYGATEFRIMRVEIRELPKKGGKHGD